jgi:hypothetical protein
VIAAQEGVSERSVRNLLSLAFLATDIIKAAVEGRLPLGFGVSRLVNMPIDWEEQMRHLGYELNGPPNGSGTMFD